MGKTRKPTVEHEGLLFEDKVLPIGSPEWFEWLDANAQFKYKGALGHFSARKEKRSKGDYWYGYRRRAGKLQKCYLGKSEEIIAQKLEEAAAQLAGHQPTPLAETSDSATQQSRVSSSFFSQTKIQPPVLPPHLIIRQRLIDRLTTPIIILNAPGGFGKSTLLNNWQRTDQNLKVAWVTLDHDDDQLLRFWTAITTSLQAIFPPIRNQSLPFLQSRTQVNTAEIILRLNNEIVQASGDLGRTALVLDNFHTIQNKEIIHSIQTWLEEIPSNFQLILSGRAQPPLALGQLRAYGRVTEIEMDDLRFTLPEGIDFLQHHVAPPALAYQDMENLINRASGWVAGLTLAVSALNRQADRRSFLNSFSGAHIFLREYFVESVLSQQPVDVQRFLLQTSILKQLNGELCDVVTGQQNGWQMLDQLWQENLFVAQSQDQAWYQYHDLFGEMLRNQLDREFATLVPTLHRRAASWYQSQNAPAEAVRHYLAIQAWEEAAQIIESVMLRELAEFGEDSRLFRWIRQLPEEIFQHHKSLLFTYLRLTKLSSHPAEIDQFLTQLEANLTSKRPNGLTADELDVLSEIRTIRKRRATGQMIVTASKSDDSRWQLMDIFWIMETNYQPKSQQKSKQVLKAYERAKTEGNLFIALITCSSCITRAFLQGNLRRGEILGKEILEYALTKREKPPEPVSTVFIVLSKIYIARNEIQRAEKALQKAPEVDPNPTSANILVDSAIIRAMIQSIQGSHEAAVSTLQMAKALRKERPVSVWRERDLSIYEALSLLRGGQLSIAHDILTNLEDSDDALWLLVKAEYFITQGDGKPAEPMLRKFLNNCPMGIEHEPVLAVQLLLAIALYQQKKYHAAVAIFEKQLELAEPERLIRPFLDHGHHLIPLLVLIEHTPTISQNIQRFVRTILQELNVSDEVMKKLADEQLKILLTATSITARELDVLKLVSDGLSNQEIAEKLYISSGTVKTHLANIYGKLTVSNRTQAVTKARDLQLI